MDNCRYRKELSVFFSARVCGRGEKMDTVREMFMDIARAFMNMDLIDLLDIFIISMLFYWVVRFIRERRAGKLAAGVIVLLLIQLIGSVLNLTAVNFILHNLFQIGITALIVVFQPEIRDVLEKMGGVRNLIPHSESKDTAMVKNTVRNVCEAACDMSSDQTGALIVLERTTGLEEYVCSGTMINAEVSKQLLKNIFFNKAPLHDGAVIIKNNRIQSAGCKLPLASQNIDLDFGTRHRAAIGMSERSDAAVVVVSEETGTISLAIGGQLKRNYDYTRLYNELMELMMPRQLSDIVTERMTQQEKRAARAARKAERAIAAAERERAKVISEQQRQKQEAALAEKKSEASKAESEQEKGAGENAVKQK